MKRKALYSRATRRRQTDAPETGGMAPDVQDVWQDDLEDEPRLGTLLWQKSRAFTARHGLLVRVSLTTLITLGLLAGMRLIFPPPAALTQWDIDNAVKYSLANTPEGPAETTLAAATVMPSVVRVDGYLSPEHSAQLAKIVKTLKLKVKPGTPTPPPISSDGRDGHPDTTGSGVVIDEKGDILTNLHVIKETDRWLVTFADGSKSEATVQSVEPENDLAVIRAKTQPDDLKPATLASTRDLYPGDRVVAVGFPFGIGPSVSSGVVAGLKREFDDPAEKDKPKLTNLIQFDAAVNPGNSGGPLVNRDGEVVGIVTAIYNPSGARVFAGMSFAVPIENAAKNVGQNPF